MAISHLVRLPQSPTRLMIRIRPFTLRQLMTRVVVGTGLGLLGWIWIDRDLWVGLVLLGIGLVVASPTDLGETIILDRSQDQVVVERYPWWIKRRIVRQPLSQVVDVQISRAAREEIDKYADESYTYRCQVLLVLRSGEHLPIARFLQHGKINEFIHSPRDLAEKMVGWIRPFLS